MENISQFSIRTDLALEAAEMFQSTQPSEIPGVQMGVQKYEGYTVTKVKVTDENGAKNVGKPIGNYVTIEAPGIRDGDVDLEEDVIRSLANEIVELAKLKEESSILVVGLGNWNVTPDALGPKVVSKILVTRHLVEHLPEQIDEGVRPVSAIAPGVMGLTGIETSETVEGIVAQLQPDLVVCIDALASRKLHRVSTTIQIADTGIQPGAGVGNKRKAINEEVLGIPVMAIGVPMVVDAATMASDTIDLVVDTLIQQTDEDSSFYQLLKDMDKEEKYHLIAEVLSPYIGTLMVTPKEVDSLIDDLSNIIANALNIALHPGIDEKDTNRFIH